MKFNKPDLLKKIQNKIPRYGEWYTWFAWYPVNVEGNEYVWLEFVEKKKDLVGPVATVVSYRKKEDIT